MPVPANAKSFSIEDFSIRVIQEIHVKAPIAVTFESLLAELGPENITPDGVKMNFVLEAWPGGRWYRELGDKNGHYWGTVQAIKRPTLLEITGPLFMSYPVSSNVQYRLSEEPGGTLIKFQHLAFGLIQDEHKQGVNRGWSHMHEKLRIRAEGKRPN